MSVASLTVRPFPQGKEARADLFEGVRFVCARCSAHNLLEARFDVVLELPKPAPHLYRIQTPACATPRCSLENVVDLPLDSADTRTNGDALLAGKDPANL